MQKKFRISTSKSRKANWTQLWRLLVRKSPNNRHRPRLLSTKVFSLFYTILLRSYFSYRSRFACAASKFVESTEFEFLWLFDELRLYAFVEQDFRSIAKCRDLFLSNTRNFGKKYEIL